MANFQAKHFHTSLNGVHVYCETSKRDCFDKTRDYWHGAFDDEIGGGMLEDQCNIVRLLKEENPTDGVIMGKALLPDLIETSHKSVYDLGELLGRLVFQTGIGCRPEVAVPSLKGLPKWGKQQALWSGYQELPKPVWWPSDLPFRDPASCSVSRRRLKEAVVRCYWLYDENDMLTDSLYDFAVSLFPSTLEHGEFPLNADIHQAFYDNFLCDSGWGVD